MGKEQNYNSIFSNCRLKNYLLSTFSIVLIGISVDSPCQCHALPIFICNLLWLGFCIRMLPAAKRSRGVWCATNVWEMIGMMLSFVPIAKGNAIAINVLQSGNNVWLLLKIKIKNKKMLQPGLLDSRLFDFMREKKDIISAKNNYILQIFFSLEKCS